MTAVLFGSLRAEIVDSPGHHTGLAGRAASCPPWWVRPAPWQHRLPARTRPSR
jgi:hypothetical protein